MYFVEHANKWVFFSYNKYGEKMIHVNGNFDTLKKQRMLLVRKGYKCSQLEYRYVK